MQNLGNSAYGGEQNMKTLNLQSNLGVSAHPGVYSADDCHSHYPETEFCTISETSFQCMWASQWGTINININGQAACHVIKVQPLVQDWLRKSPPHSRFLKYCFFVQETGLIWRVRQVPCFHVRENSFTILQLSLKQAKGERALWRLPKHEVCAVNLPTTSAVLQNSSVPNYCTFLKLGAVVRHILQHHSKKTANYPKTWMQQVSFLFFPFFLLCTAASYWRCTNHKNLTHVLALSIPMAYINT